MNVPSVFKIAVLLSFLAAAPDILARGSVHVRSYTKKDGTFVHAHDRALPGTGASSYNYSVPSSSSSNSTIGATNPAPTSYPFIAAPDPARDPNWVPAKILSGQYIAGHFKNDPAFAAVDGPPPNIPWRPDPPARVTRTTTRSPSSYARTQSSYFLPRSAQIRYPRPYRLRLTARERRALYGAVIDAIAPSASTSDGTTAKVAAAYSHHERSQAAKRAFMRQTGYPHGRPGYVVDHIVPLKRGGADDPSNMQWQTVEEAKAKDKWE
ncbi:MAG: hypothetical protein QOH88_3438 [Verrucomicrobiota bacterium]|jgi:hypothetical protein